MSLADLDDRHRDAPVWNARRGVGSFVTFEIGDEVEPGTGQLHVWVQYAAWSLERDGQPPLTSQQHAVDFAAALVQLDGESLQAIVADERDGLVVVVMRFSGGFALRLRADLDTYEAEDDLITFFEHEHDTISVNQRFGVYTESPG